jgi:TPR repeat protein
MKRDSWSRCSIFLACSVAFGFCGTAIAGPMEDATAAYQRGDNVTAVKLLRPLAEAGNANAQFYLGGMYDYGLGIAQNRAEAVAWYRKAADQGNSQAQVNLGSKYQIGQGVDRDFVEAAKWYRRAADQGSAIAQLNLGMMFARGQGVLSDYGEAAKWFLRAAEQGNAIAQISVATMFSEGQGVGRDYVQAYKWWTVAATRLPSSEKARRDATLKERDGMASKMTPAHIAEAKKLADAWKPATAAR